MDEVEERGEEPEGGSEQGVGFSFVLCSFFLAHTAVMFPHPTPKALTRSTEMSMARPREGLRTLESSLSPASCPTSTPPNMPLFPSSPKKGEIPVYNSACPWASSADDLKALYLSPFTPAVTTRTCTLNGFADDASKHQVCSAALSFVLIPYSSLPSRERRSPSSETKPSPRATRMAIHHMLSLSISTG